MTKPTPSYSKLALGVFAVLVAATLWRVDRPRPPAPLDVSASTVILVTLDGVRPDELLFGADPDSSDGRRDGPVMPYLMDTLVPNGVFLGDFRRGSRFTLGNPMGISVPSYQSIFTGRPTICVRNECNSPWGRTLIDAIEDGSEGARPPVGFFSYYDRVCGAAKVAPRLGGVMCGPNMMERAGSVAPDWSDEEVFAKGLANLTRETPRFLYIGLGESDSAGHSANYDRYLSVLGRYDGFLSRLDGEMERMARNGHRITLIVTTDHGRGQAGEWTEHRWNVAGTARLWLFAKGYEIAERGPVAGGRKGSLYDIRATVQYLLGLPDPRGLWQGDILRDVLRQPAP